MLHMLHCPIQLSSRSFGKKTLSLATHPEFQNYKIKKMKILTVCFFDAATFFETHVKIVWLIFNGNDWE